MAVLEDEFARAAAGEFRVVLLSGEAGVGKSRLGRELLARHPEAAGLFARAHPLGVTAAFGVWAEAIDPLLQGRSDRQVVAACGGLLDGLAEPGHEAVACHRRGRSPAAEVLARSLERTRDQTLRHGVVDAGEFQAVLATLRDPSFTFVDALSVAAWGKVRLRRCQPGPRGSAIVGLSGSDGRQEGCEWRARDCGAARSSVPRRRPA